MGSFVEDEPVVSVLLSSTRGKSLECKTSCSSGSNIGWIALNSSCCKMVRTPSCCSSFRKAEVVDWFVLVLLFGLVDAEENRRVQPDVVFVAVLASSVVVVDV